MRLGSIQRVVGLCYYTKMAENPGGYLLHRLVFKENSTKKIRSVFDTSFLETRKNLSVNCCLKGLMKFSQQEIRAI